MLDHQHPKIYFIYRSFVLFNFFCKILQCLTNLERTIEFVISYLSLSLSLSLFYSNTLTSKKNKKLDKYFNWMYKKFKKMCKVYLKSEQLKYKKVIFLLYFKIYKIECKYSHIYYTYIGHWCCKDQTWKAAQKLMDFSLESLK